MKKTSVRIAAFLTATFLLISLFSAMPVMSSEEGETDIVLVEVNDADDMRRIMDLGTEVIYEYDDHVLIEANPTAISMMEDMGMDIDVMEHGTKLYINGYDFDIKDGDTSIPDELRIEGYNTNVKGLYIVHMVGPIAQDWRSTLEDMGVDVLNYMPNNAYRVRMTPELADEVSELYFVDWTGIYHPYYKIQPDMEPGMINIGMVPHAGTESIFEVQNIVNYFSLSESNENGYRFVGYVDSANKINELTQINDVLFVSQYSEPVLTDEMATQVTGGGLWFFDDHDTDPDTAYRLHGHYGSYMNQIGYTGAGITIAVADTGLGGGTTTDQHADFQSRVVDGHTFTTDGSWEDGHSHGTHCAGSAAGHTYAGTTTTVYSDYYAGQGSAPAAELFSVRIFDGGGGWAGPADQYEIVQVAAQLSDSYVHTNSWGAATGGAYGDRDSNYDWAVRDADRDSPGNHQMVITVAAGNSGSGDNTIGSPGNAKNVITVGGTQPYNPPRGYSNPEAMYGSSSRGWTDDNRVKPDVLAPARSIYSTGITSGYSYKSGTSMANPAVAGAAAVTVEWFQNTHGYTPSPAMVKALLINTANPISGSRGDIPNQDEGWGMTDISKLNRPLGDPVPFYLSDQEHIFTNSLETNVHDVGVDRIGEPLKFSLTWTDKEAPAGTGSGPTLINDLNIIVESPSGSIYRGNAFSGGWSVAGANAIGTFDRNGDGWDDTNNVENVYIPQAEVEDGLYTVTIEARSITDDAVNTGGNSQDYALAVYNGASVTSDGIVSLDKNVYSLEDTALITLRDLDLSGTGSHDVTIDSTTEPTGETVTLIETTTEGVFEGTIDLSETNSLGVLQVSDGDTVTVSYFDADIGDGTSATKTDTATVDGTPPVISLVSSITKLAARVEWTTDKPSDTKVNYGRTTSLGSSTSSAPYVTSHSIFVDGLVPGQTYYYEVISTDEAGNTAVDDNGGLYYTFTPTTIDDVEAGNVGWTPDNNWQVWGTNVYAGAQSWNCGNGNYGTVWDEKLVSPVIDTSLWSDATWTWYHSYDFEASWDGGVVEINDGTGWTRVTPAGGYDGTLSTGYDNVLEGQDAFTGDSGGWVMESVILDPYLSTGTIQVRYWMGTDSYDTNDAGWNIDDIEISGTITTLPPSITLTRPTGGETWTAGNNEDITWSTTAGDGTITGVDIDYSTDGGVSWTNIVTGTADDGVHTWTVPDEPTTEARIRATVNDDNGMSDTHTSGNFEIAEVTFDPPSITLTRPTGGETWYAGDNEDITWTTTAGEGTITGVDLEYSTDAGASWTTIVTGTADAGSHTWSVPDEHTSEARVRATVHDNNGMSDTDTSLNFDIVGVPPVAPTDLNVQHTGSVADSTTETRYMRADDVLGTTQSATNQAGADLGNNADVYAGIRVWVVDDLGTETEFTSGSAVGIASILGNNDPGAMVAGATWTAPETALEPTDSIRVRLYQGTTSPPASLIGTFTTEELGATQLDAVAWEPHYFIVSSRNNQQGSWVGWGSDTRNTRIENFQHSVTGGDGTEDNLITWNASADEPAKVTGYNIYRSDSSTGPWNLTGTVAADGGPYSYVDPGAGTADGTLWWYMVYSDQDGYEGGGAGPVQEPGETLDTFMIDLFAGGNADGWNFVSFNLELGDTNLETILTDIDGSYDKVMYYDASTGQWQSYVPGRAAHYNNIDTWNHHMGLWIHATVDDTLTVEGSAPVSTDITLYPGWNMVGLPSETAGNHGLPAEVSRIGEFDATDEYNMVYTEATGTFQFQPGEGYMVYLDHTEPVVWTVNY